MNRPKPVKPEDYILEKVLASYTIDPEKGEIYNSTGLPATMSNGANGRIVISLWDPIKKRSRNLQASHLIWWKHTGEWPFEMLDHEDRNKGNNKIGNLRYTNKSLNALNSRLGDLKGAWREQLTS